MFTTEFDVGRYKDKPIKKLLHEVKDAGGEQLDRFIIVNINSLIVIVIVIAIVIIVIGIFSIMNINLGCSNLSIRRHTIIKDHGVTME